jgi:hypothetical protein
METIVPLSSRICAAGVGRLLLRGHVEVPAELEARYSSDRVSLTSYEVLYICLYIYEQCNTMPCHLWKAKSIIF